VDIPSAQETPAPPPSGPEIRIGVSQTREHAREEVRDYIVNRPDESIPLIVVRIRLPPDMNRLASRHQLPTNRRRPGPGRDPEEQPRPGGYVFITPVQIDRMDVADTELLVYEKEPVAALAELTPRRFSFLLKKDLSDLLPCLTAPLRDAFGFKQRPCFPLKYNRQKVCILRTSSKGLG
jgi:hypothetical protein